MSRETESRNEPARSDGMPAEDKAFIDARLKWLRHRGEHTTLPYPTRAELDAFYDGYMARCTPSETGMRRCETCGYEMVQTFRCPECHGPDSV